MPWGGRGTHGAIGLGNLEYVLEEGARWNWFDDATITACALIAGVAGILFVIRSLTFAHPLVDLRALGNRNFALGCLLSLPATCEEPIGRSLRLLVPRRLERHLAG